MYSGFKTSQGDNINVTRYKDQNILSLTDLTGCEFNYRPSSDTNYVIIEVAFEATVKDSLGLIHFWSELEINTQNGTFNELKLDDGNSYPSRMNWGTNGALYGGRLVHRQKIIIADSGTDDDYDNSLVNWSQMRRYRLRIEAYSSSYEMRVNRNAHWNNTSASNRIPPMITITSYGSRSYVEQ